MIRTLLLIAGFSCLVLGSEHADLPAGGTLRLKNSTGDLTIEGWDQPGVEITTAKSGPRSGDVKVAVTREGNDLVITTDFPRHRRFPPRPSVGRRDFGLEYLIKVPRDAKVVVDHDAGEIHFDGLTGDIHATMNQGAITVRVAADSQYAIDAKSRIGDVTSDIAGTKTRKQFGHALVQAATAPQSLYLRTGFGDIIVLREPGRRSVPQ
jgi:hypothetical protein